MPYEPRRNLEGWYWLGLCLSLLLGTTLWACWPLLPTAGAGAQVATPPHTDAAPPGARTPEPWYLFDTGQGQCILAQGKDEPVQKIKDFTPLGKSVFMRDVTEQGVVVQTTMVSRNALMLTGLGLSGEAELWRWFRGRERCEQAHRATVQAEEETKRRRQQAQDQQLKKYR